MTIEKPKPKQLLRPITTGADSAMNQSQFLAIPCNSLEAREKSRVHGAVGLGFDSHWLKNWRESFKPITNRSSRNHVITFDSHLKTALMRYAIPVIVIQYTCWVRMMPKFRMAKEKEKQEDTGKRPQQKVQFFSIKAWLFELKGLR